MPLNKPLLEPAIDYLGVKFALDLGAIQKWRHLKNGIFWSPFPLLSPLLAISSYSPFPVTAQKVTFFSPKGKL